MGVTAPAAGAFTHLTHLLLGVLTLPGFTLLPLLQIALVRPPLPPPSKTIRKRHQRHK
jgi:hypothetical protein